MGPCRATPNAPILAVRLASHALPLEISGACATRSPRTKPVSDCGVEWGAGGGQTGVGSRGAAGRWAEVRLTVMVFVCSGLATRAALYLAQIPDILEVWGSGGKVEVVEGWRESGGAEEMSAWSASDW